MKNKIHILILALITSAYAAVSFINLGNAFSPQTFIRTINGDQIILDFGGIYEFTRINYFSGIGDLKVSFDVSDDGQNWERITDTYNEDGTLTFNEIAEATYASSFSWHVTRVNTSGRYLCITTFNGNTELFEIAVYNGENLLPVAFCSAPELIDEQAFSQRSKTYLNSMYFDEIYHARSAYEIINRLPVYETVHPPLGKVFIAASISAFGMTPFAWRLSGTITGILMIPAFFLLANKLFSNKAVSLTASALFALDFMHFSLTRIATIDSYPVFFIILTFYFLAVYINGIQISNNNKRRFIPLIWAGIFFGLACASKWTGLYTAPGILFLLIFTWYNKIHAASSRIKFRREIINHFFICIGVFIVIPVVIYLASYIPQMRYDMSGFTPFQYVLNSITNMYKYHSGLDAVHPFSSPAITWPVIYKPLWAYTDNESIAYGIVSSIAFLGNPVIWWTGLFSIITLFNQAFRSLLYVPVFISTGFLTNYFAWLLVPRIVFIYHYFASVPFIILAVCYWIDQSWNNKIKTSIPWLWIFLVFAAFVLFAWFYPVLSGASMSVNYAESLRWFKSWNIFSSGR